MSTRRHHQTSAARVTGREPPRPRIHPAAASALEAGRLHACATAVCGRAGYPVRGDPEYASAVNYGVLRSLYAWNPGDPSNAKPETLAVLCALRECRKARGRLRLLRRGDRAGAGRGLAEQPAPLPLPVADFEFLSFVAAQGRARAARLLAVSQSRLRERLDEAVLRVRHLLNED